MKQKLTYFYTNECPKCQDLNPVIKELENFFDISYVNTHESISLVESYDIEWVPTFVLEDKNGKHKFEGIKEITTFIKKII
jgi:thiol-disulfide isomerase/thioredoxin